MNLRTVIEHYYGGSRRAFIEAVGCSEKTAYRWLQQNAVVAHGQLYLSVRRDIPTPRLPAPDKRAEFESRLVLMQPDADLTRVGEQYLAERVQCAWLGWLMAQEHQANDDLAR
ncbi:hypothetical protein M8623_003392 [Salmonella enterica subsp. enterica]|nr:hypothetical protein [Salmonella enterica subsp. enterica]